MSDNSDLGGFGPTTPGPIKQRAKGGASKDKTDKKQQQQRIVDDRDPGPSTKRTLANTAAATTTSGNAAKKRKGGGGVKAVEEDLKATMVYIEDDDVVVESSDDEERQVEIVEKGINGRQQKGKMNGKTKSQPRQQRQKQKSVKTIVVQASEEEDEGDEEDEDEEDVVHVNPPPSQTNVRNGVKAKDRSSVTNRGKAKKGKDTKKDLENVLEGPEGVNALLDRVGQPSATANSIDTAKDKELARLKEKIARLEKEKEALSHQMEELFRIRETEAEAAMRESEERYEAKIRGLEDVNKALTEQLTKKQLLAGSGKSSILHLITRETADEERQSLDQEVSRLKKELENSKEIIRSKDQQIEEFKQLEKDLRIELKAEIDRANSLAKQASTRQPQATPRSGLIGEDPKHGEAIKLYEDLTNIIIINIRSSMGKFRNDEWMFNCCYTHTNESDSEKATTYSLNFSLRSYQDEIEGERMEWIQYTPSQLEQEAPEFVEQLGFLNTAFQFERVQLALFLRSLYTNFEDIVKSNQVDSDEEDMVE